MNSPYENKSVSEWLNITKELINKHPLNIEEIIKIVLSSWSEILETRIGDNAIGKDISPKPQIMGSFLHELISLKLEKMYPQIWRCEKSANDKDIVCIPEKLKHPAVGCNFLQQI